MYTLVLIWMALFGLWPLADPGHDSVSFVSRLDVSLHFVAILVLLYRWLS